MNDRQRGALIGLAIGDALGAAVEFMSPGRFKPVTGYRGGGPHGLKAGEWTDDTSMALASCAKSCTGCVSQARLPEAQRRTPPDSSRGVCMNGTAGREQSKSGGDEACTLRLAS